MTTYHGYDSKLLQQRGRHDKVAVDEVRDGSRKRAARVVIVPCRRVIEELEHLGLWEAFASIDRAVSLLTAGLNVRAMDLSRVRGGNVNFEHGAEVIEQYKAWHEECKRRYYSPIMVLEVVVDGLTFPQIDTKHQFRKGTAEKNLINCLKLWH